jgi:hypothetical protein
MAEPMTILLLDELLAYLEDLGRERTRPETALRRLDAIRQRHPGFTIDLVWEGDGPDGSLHYDVQVWPASGGMVLLSYAAVGPLSEPPAAHPG